MIPLVHDADVVTLIGTKLPATVIEAMGRCRLIAWMGTGTDRIVGHVPLNWALWLPTRLIFVWKRAGRSCDGHAPTSPAPKLDRGRTRDGRRQCHAGTPCGEQQPTVSKTTLGLVGFGRSAGAYGPPLYAAFGMRVLATRNNKHAPTTEADMLGVITTDLETVRAKQILSRCICP